jgi:hypothetical protein
MRPLINILCCFCAISSYAQDNDDTSATFRLSEIALIDLEPNNAAVSLKVVAPNNAGEKAIIVATNNNKWINFSSAVKSSTASRSIFVKIVYGQVPPGIYLKLRTENYSGFGEYGKTPSLITLNNQEQTIVTGIRGAYTGNGADNGFKLTYELDIYDYKLLDFDQSATLSISLTLTDF